MRILTHTIAPCDDGRTLGRVAQARFSLSVTQLRALKVRDAILLDGVAQHTNCIVHAGQVITLCLLAYTPQGEGAACLRVAYRDEDILVVDKDAPLPTLPSRHQCGETLREQVGEYLGAGGDFTFRPVNRLDKGTSGLLVVALHAHAQQLLARQLHTQGFVREYLAVTQGIPAQPQGVIDAPIARVPGETVRRCVREEGLPARTHYSVERVCDGRALVRLRLETGRTHQIRVHLAAIGCPIVGDYLYGEEMEALAGRFALHSTHIALTQPLTQKQVTVQSPLPSVLHALLEEKG